MYKFQENLLSLQRGWDLTTAPVVQKLDSTIHRINHYPVDKYQGNQLRYPVWIVIYQVNNVNHLLNNLDLANILQSWLWILKKNTTYDGNKLIMNIVLVYSMIFNQSISYRLVFVNRQ